MIGNAARQAGELDPEFNGGKVNLSHLGLDPVFMTQVRPTPDGGVLVTARGRRGERFISKFTRQGELDPNFREKGYFPIEAQQQLIVAVDGGFYLVDKLSATRLFVEKFHANGQPDERYGEKGKAIIDFAGVDSDLLGAEPPRTVPDLGSTVLAALDGESLYVISAGYWGGWNGFRTVIARLNPSGVLDQSFGKQGFVLFNRPGERFNLPIMAQIQSIAGQPASLILQVDEVRPTFEWVPGYYSYLYRIKGAGSFDGNFGHEGRLSTHLDQGLSVKYFVDEQQTLKAGCRYDYDKVEVHGWTVDGGQDENFEALSISMPPEMNIGLGLKSFGAGVDYRLVHFGSRHGEAEEKRDVYCYLADGNGDPAFGENGTVTLDVRYSGWLMNVELEVVPGTHDLFFTTVDDVFRLKGR